MVFFWGFILSAFGLTFKRGKWRLPTGERYFFCKTINLVTLEGVSIFGPIDRFNVGLVGVDGYHFAWSYRGLLYILTSNVNNGGLVRYIYIINSNFTLTCSLVLGAKG